MGAANIIEKNIQQTTTSLWNKVPIIPQHSLFNFSLSNYNKSFVNFAIVCGIVALAKTTITLKNHLANQIKESSNKMPTKNQLTQKYGHHSYVLVTNVQSNEQYCRIFAQYGFNLILMGEEKKMEEVKFNIQRSNLAVQIITYAVNWKKVQIDLSFYEKLVDDLKDYDISFMILPKLVAQNDNVPTHLDHSQPFQHVYLLVRYLGGKLKFRSYRSCIIFPSYQKIQEITCQNGITKSLIAGSDAFGRIASYQLKGTVDIVVARGSAENALKGMGKHKITH